MTSALPSYRRTHTSEKKACCGERPPLLSTWHLHEKSLTSFLAVFFFCIEILLEARHLIQRRLREFGHFRWLAKQASSGSDDGAT